jgi:tRNA A-37 threonylcarbamoyl transferase component Bud32
MHPLETSNTRFPLLGRVVSGRYRVSDIIGSGGMATVYRVQDQRLGRTVALKILLKILHPQLAADQMFLQRFRKEAESAAGLSSHPHIVSLHDVDEDGDVHYLVIEYVPGPNLKEIIAREAPFSVERAFAIGQQVASALAYAHEQGVIHRDIKPQNILIGPDDAAKVADFGIARQVDATQMTQSGVLLGSAAYLSPEQVDGKPAGPASDIYSLGVVLFEMLTGRLPFDADTPVGMAMKHLHEQPAALTELNPAIGAGTAGIVLLALAKDPSARYASAAALGAALQEHIRAPAVERTAYRPLGAETTVQNRQPLPVGSRRTLPVVLGLLGLAGAVVLALLFTAGPGSRHTHRVAGTHGSPGAHRTVHAGATATARPTAHTLAATNHQPMVAPKAAAPARTSPPAPTASAATAPPSGPVGVAGALVGVRSAIANGVASGQVQPIGATDLEHSVDALQTQLQHGHAKDIKHKIADLQHKVDGHIHDGSITPVGPQRIDAALATLQGAVVAEGGPQPPKGKTPKPKG